MRVVQDSVSNPILPTNDPVFAVDGVALRKEQVLQTESVRPVFEQ